MSHPVQPYNKPACSPADHLAKLKARNLIVNDQAYAEGILGRVGYYRLLVYMRPFQSGPARNFVKGTTFENVVYRYDFDRKLRLLCLDAIERIEVCVRAFVVNEIATLHGPHFYLESRHFRNPSEFRDKSLKMAQAVKHTTTKHYYSKYNFPSLPPLWAVAEGMNFGELSRFFSALHPDLQQVVAKKFKYPRDTVISWLRSSNDLRNRCAHHNLLWNALLVEDAPVRPTGTSAAAEIPSSAGSPAVTSTFHARAVMLVELMKVADPRAAWKQRLIALLDEHAPHIDEAAMGFTSGWRARPFWR